MNEPQKPKAIKLADLNFDIVTSLRTGLDDDAVENYLQHWDQLPPIEVFFDGTTNWVVDGGHRGAAGKLGEKKTVRCVVRQGTKREAELEAMGRNEDHGVRRTAEEKRKIVERLLDDPEWGKKSQRWIAEAARVDPKTIRAIKAERSGEDAPQLVEGKDGKTYPAVGKRKKPKVDEVAATESEAWDCMICGKENAGSVEECEHEGLDVADPVGGVAAEAVNGDGLGVDWAPFDEEDARLSGKPNIRLVPSGEPLVGAKDPRTGATASTEPEGPHPTVVAGRPLRRPSPAPGTPTVFSSPFVFGYEHEGRRRLELIKSALMIGVDGAWVGFDLAFLTDEEFARLVQGMQETRV